MNYQDFIDLVNSHPNSVVLIEGTRKLPESDSPKLVQICKRLANDLPKARFRTGNAKGADEAFAMGIQMVDPSRLEYILPYPSHRKQKISECSTQVAVTEVSAETESIAVETTMDASPEYSSMLQNRDKVPKLKIKSQYILRDTIKVTGALDISLLPATVGIFYINTQDPMKGGTGHTMRVCRKLKVPVITQDEWMRWI